MTPPAFSMLLYRGQNACTCVHNISRVLFSIKIITIKQQQQQQEHSGDDSHSFSTSHVAGIKKNQRKAAR